VGVDYDLREEQDGEQEQLHTGIIIIIIIIIIKRILLKCHK